MNEYPCPQYLPPLLTIDAMNTLFGNIAGGVKEVQYADKKVVYQSVADMMKIYRWMEGLLYPCGNSGRPVKITADYNSGLNRHGDGFETEEHSFRFY